MPDYIVVWHDGNGQIDKEGVTRVSEQEYFDQMEAMSGGAEQVENWVCGFPVSFIPEG